MIKNILKNKSHCYFISPHLDDAAFSAGGILTQLSGKVPITIINVFTNAGDGINTLSARRYLQQCKADNARNLFKSRIEEDKIALASIKAKVVNLNQTDALWRKKPSTSFKFPELNRVYPTYRWHIITGRISKYDKAFEMWLQQKLKSLITTKNYVVFCPVGFGNHVDHLIVRNACIQSFKKDKMYYWSDFPYYFRDKTSDNFISKNNLQAIELRHQGTNKKRMCRQYKTQFEAVITDPKTLNNAEIFYHHSGINKLTFSKKIKLHIYDITHHPKDYLFSYTYSNKKKIHIKEFDQKVRSHAEEMVDTIKNQHSHLQPIIIGSTGLKIAGQGDIDILVPVSRDEFSQYTLLLKKVYGEPQKIGETMIQWKLVNHISSVDLDLIDINSSRYKNQIQLFDILKNNKNALNEYIQFKWQMNGESAQTYTRGQICFFDYIVNKYAFRKDSVSLPRNIDNFTLQKQLLQEKKSKIYAYGKYRNQKGIDAFAKIWQSKHKDRAYYALQNEIQAYQLIEKTSIKSSVKTPKFLHSHASNGLLVLLIQSVGGDNPSKLPISRRAKTFQEVFMYLEKLYNVLPKQNTITKRSRWYWLAILPVIACIALIRHPGKRRGILNGLHLFWLGLGSFIKDKKLTLTHRDIGNWNILVGKKNTWLIDLQLMAMAHPYIEHVVFLLKVWGDRQLVERHLNTPLIKEIMKSTQEMKIFKAYAVIFALYDLALEDGGDPQYAHEFLAYIINL